jgi:hypothetical protein
MLTPNPLSLSAIATQLRHRVLTRPILAIGGAGLASVDTTAAIVYSVDGRVYNKAILADQSIATIATGAAPAYVQPASTTVYYVLCLDKDGNVRTVQGTYLGQSMGVGRIDKGQGGIPDVPDGYTPFGMIKVVTAAANTFTLGTTALDAAGKTFTFYDLDGTLPSVAP